MFLTSFYIKVNNGEKLLTLIESCNEWLQFLQKTFFEKTILESAMAKNIIFSTPPVGQKSESSPIKLLFSLY